MGKADVRRAEKARSAAQAEERRRVVLNVLDGCRDETAAELGRLAARGVTPSCAAGCVHCCRLEIPVTRPEAEVVVAWLEANRDPAALEVIRDKLRAWLAWYRGEYVRATAAGQSRDEVFHRHAPMCALIEDGGRCGVYEVRPVTCRNHYASSPAQNCAPDGSGDVTVMFEIAIATRPHVARIRNVIEAQGGRFEASVHLLQEWLAHLLGVEREPWIGAPPLRLG